MIAQSHIRDFSFQMQILNMSEENYISYKLKFIDIERTNITGHDNISDKI